jgi:hypothetical protein
MSSSVWSRIPTYCRLSKHWDDGGILVVYPCTSCGQADLRLRYPLFCCVVVIRPNSFFASPISGANSDLNSLTGSIPTEMGLMTSLTWLQLSKNVVSCLVWNPNVLSFIQALGRWWHFGRVPNAPRADKVRLLLRYPLFCCVVVIRPKSFFASPISDLNSLTGSIPTEMGLVTSLTTLYLGKNVVICLVWHPNALSFIQALR